MSKYHNDRTRASDAVGIGLSDAKLRLLQPDLYGWRSWFKGKRGPGKMYNSGALREMIREHMSLGDSRAALVVQTSPILIVAAYTDEQDAVVLLRFEQWLVEAYGLTVGKRLLTVNTYWKGKRMMPDIVAGPEQLGRWMNYYPIIAEFVSEDDAVIEKRKREIGEAEWGRAAKFARALTASGEPMVRDGRPEMSMRLGQKMRIR